MKEHGCKVCGYRYDPKKGDRFTGVEPGTEFEVLENDWRCPICRAGKTSFEPMAGDNADQESGGSTPESSA